MIIKQENNIVDIRGLQVIRKLDREHGGGLLPFDKGSYLYLWYKGRKKKPIEFYYKSKQDRDELFDQILKLKTVGMCVNP